MFIVGIYEVGCHILIGPGIVPVCHNALEYTNHHHAGTLVTEAHNVTASAGEGKGSTGAVGVGADPLAADVAILVIVVYVGTLVLTDFVTMLILGIETDLAFVKAIVLVLVRTRDFQTADSTLTVTVVHGRMTVHCDHMGLATRKSGGTFIGTIKTVDIICINSTQDGFAWTILILRINASSIFYLSPLSQIFQCGGGMVGNCT